MNELGRTLRHIREVSGRRQWQVAQAAGVTPGFLSLVEKGQRMPTLDVLTAIAKALDVPLLLIIYRAESDAWMNEQTRTWLALEWQTRFPDAPDALSH